LHCAPAFGRVECVLRTRIYWKKSKGSGKLNGNSRFLHCVIALRANTPVEMTPRGKIEFKGESNDNDKGKGKGKGQGKGRGNRRFLHCVIALRANTPVEMTPKCESEFKGKSKSESNGKGKGNSRFLRSK
jgi:hypothetical protein